MTKKNQLKQTRSVVSIRFSSLEKEIVSNKANESKMSLSEYIRQASLRSKPMCDRIDRVVHPQLPEINYKSYVELVEIKKALVIISAAVKMRLDRGEKLPQDLNPVVFEHFSMYDLYCIAQELGLSFKLDEKKYKLIEKLKT